MATTAAAQAKAAFGSATLLALLSLLAAHLGRDRARGLQADLWKRWGGAPTSRRLRFRDGGSAERVQRRHDAFERVTGHALPSADDEAANPVGADEAYEDAVALVRDLTRDRSRFGVLFSENADYGFRRNMLGLRGWSVAVALLVLAGAILIFALDTESVGARLTAALPAAAWSVGVLAFDLLVVKDAWVRLPAEAYADQLVTAAETLAQTQRQPGT